MGFEPSFRSIASSICEGEDIPHEMDFLESSACYCFTRLFLASEIPLIHSKTFIPLEIIKSIDVQECVERQERVPESVYEFLEERCGVAVDHQACEIQSVLANEELSTLLACPMGSPLLRLDDFGYSSEHILLFMAINQFKGDMVSFRQLRRPGVNIRST